jgi:hypothetical protein
MREASIPYDKNDEVLHNINLFKIKIASEKFIRHTYYKTVTDQMDSGVGQVLTLNDFSAFHGNAMKAKFYLTNTSKLLSAWFKGLMVNTATMRNLKKELRNEMLELFLKTLGQGAISSLTDEELLVLTYVTDIGVKAGIDFSSQFLAGQALKFGGKEMLLRWVGGPAGIALMIAPLFLSGTLPEETRWTDLTQKYPELVLTPERMTETSITKDPKRALLIHCWAWERREYFMNRRAKMIIANDEKNLAASIKMIRMEPYYKSQRESVFKGRVDNTFVKKPVPLKIKL